MMVVECLAYKISSHSTSLVTDTNGKVIIGLTYESLNNGQVLRFFITMMLYCCPHCIL